MIALAFLRQILMRYPRRWILSRDLRLLHDVVERSELAGRFRVCGGLLLGWAREGRPLDHDTDVDFFYDDAHCFEAAVPAIMAAGFRPLYRFVNNDDVVTEHSFHRHGMKFEFFRIFPCGRDSSRYFTYSPAPVPIEMVAEIPRQKAVPFAFLERSWLKPADHERELHAMYGEWRVPNPAWSYLDELCIVDRRPWRNTDYVWRES